MQADKQSYSALVEAAKARDTLRVLGWQDGRSAPRDGSAFEVIQPGVSVGIFRCTKQGEYAMVEDGNDIYPQRLDGLMWRPTRQ